MVPSFPPLRDSSGLLAPSVTSCPSPLSFLPICPLSARFCVFSRPPPVSGTPHCPSPMVRPSKSYQPSGFGRPMSSSVFPTQRPICRFAPPSDMCVWWYMDWVWVEGRKETALPAIVLSPSSRLTSRGKACLRRRSNSLSIPAVPVSLSPPTPLPVHPYLSLYSPS